MHTSITAAIATINIHVYTQQKLKVMTNNNYDVRFIHFHGRPNQPMQAGNWQYQIRFFVSEINEQWGGIYGFIYNNLSAIHRLFVIGRILKHVRWKLLERYRSIEQILPILP
jgi:hypothetical protein